MSFPQYTSSQYKVVATTHDQFDTALTKDKLYRLTANVNMYFKIGATGVEAAPADGSHLLIAGDVAIFAVTEDAQFFGFEGVAAGVTTLSRIVA
jgi:hypothetical protein